MVLTRVRAQFDAFLADESGASAVEYGLIAGGIFVAISAIIYQFGDTLEDTYQSVDDSFE
jgi:pilus assembly protein Flp/PilA